MSRTQKSIRNITFAIAGQAAGIIITFVSRKVFVVFLNVEYLGINGLFTNILSILSLAELGVGSAIVYSLYKPLAENDQEKVKSLMRLFRKAYMIIGCAVGVIGLSLTPFLSSFVSEMPDISHIELIYILFVMNSAVSYFFTYKRSLIIADQNQHIVTIYHYCIFFALNAAQIAVLAATQNFLLYLAMQVSFTVIENALISRKANNLYPYLRDKNVARLEKEDKTQISKNIRAMMIHKIGGVVVFGTDNLLLSKLVSVAYVGLYSNYYLIISAINAVIGLATQSITPSLGNLGVMTDREKNNSVFHALNFIIFWIYGFSSICLMILFNPFVKLWLGEEYLLGLDIIAVIVFNFYITGMRKGVLACRDALGLFWYDRYKPLFESAINLGVSIWLGIELGAIGIFIGMAVSTLATCFWVEPYVLYKHGFHKSVLTYFKRYAVYTLICAAAGFVTYFITTFVYVDGIGGFALKALICAIVPNAIFLLVFHKTQEFKYLWGIVKKYLGSIFRRGKKLTR